MKCLERKLCPLANRHRHPHDFSCIDVEHSTDIDLMRVIFQLGKVRCPDMIFVAGDIGKQQVGVMSKNTRFFLPFPASSPIGLYAKLPHDTLDALAVQVKRVCYPTRTISVMLPECFVNACLEPPIFCFFFGYVIERGARDTQSPSYCALIFISTQLFFWV